MTALCVPLAVGASALGPLLDLELPRLGGAGEASIREHLSPDATLVLVIWNSDCPDCLENVREAGELDAAALGAKLLGVNFDPGRREGERFCEERGLAFPQLHDPDGLVADMIGSTGTSFSFALLDGAGELLAIQYDSVPDARETITSALAAVALARESDRGLVPLAGMPPLGKAPRDRDGKPGGTTTRAEGGMAQGTTLVAVQQRYPRIRGQGRARVRWLAVGLADELDDEACACALGGPYGETLAPTVALLYRFDYELTAQVARGVTAGGRLRLSNEDPALLANGPIYFTNEYGSAFAELRRGDWSGRAGYYDVAFTPLTLQRWDLADNPPTAGSGGASGCGVCPGTARALSLEALDDLGPLVTFEGARVSGAPAGWLELTALYARPRRARDWDQVVPERFAYRQDLWGARAVLSRPLAGWGRATLGASYVAARDAENSSLWPTHLPPVDPLSFFHRNEVHSVDLALPLPAGFALGGELARGFRRENRIDQLGEGVSGDAWLVEARHRGAGGLSAAAAWLRVGAGFEAAYRALSYLPDTEGPRLSASFEREAWGVSLFYKDLRRIEDCPCETEAPLGIRSASGLVSLRPTGKLTLELAATQTRTELEPSRGETCDCDDLVLGTSLRWELARRSMLALDYTKIHSSGDSSGGEGKADIGSLMLSVEF